MTLVGGTGLSTAGESNLADTVSMHRREITTQNLATRIELRLSPLHVDAE